MRAQLLHEMLYLPDEMQLTTNIAKSYNIKI